MASEEERMPQLFADEKRVPFVDAEVWPLTIVTILGLYWVAPWALAWPLHYAFFDMYGRCVTACIAGLMYLQNRKPDPRPLKDPRPLSFAQTATEKLRSPIALTTSSEKQPANDGAPCVVDSGKGGLGVYASRDIVAGEKILFERPVALTVTKQALKNTCAVCLADCRAKGLRAWDRRCLSCEQQYYCSESCAKIASIHHKGIECNALREGSELEKLEDEDEMDLAVLAVRILADRAKKLRCETGAAGRLDAFEACTQRMIGVSTGTDKRKEQLQKRSEATLKVLPQHARVPLEQLMDLFERIECNLYGVPAKKANEGEVAALSCFAGHFHLFNHACWANVVFDSGCSVDDAMPDGSAPSFGLYAVEDIKQGAELCISYRRCSDDDRHTFLVDHYGFKCGCAFCTGDRATREAIEELEDSLTCPAVRCGGGLGVPIRKSSDDERGLRCVMCNQEW